MRKVQVWAEFTDEHFQAYQSEAQRQGVKVEKLIEQTVNCLIKELEQEEAEGPEYTIPS